MHRQSAMDVDSCGTNSDTDVVEVEAFGEAGVLSTAKGPYKQLLQSQRAEGYGLGDDTQVAETIDDKWARIVATREEEQKNAKEAAKDALMQPCDEDRRALVVMACGTGKTHVFIKTADECAAELVIRAR